MTIPSWCRVGAKVVCVAKHAPPCREGCATYPRYGEVCTIREVFVTDEGVFVHLAEHVNPPVYTTSGFRERAVEVRWLRPVNTQEQDLAAHFNQYLDHTAPANLEPAE